jgi:hypothetical protein
MVVIMLILKSFNNFLRFCVIGIWNWLRTSAKIWSDVVNAVNLPWVNIVFMKVFLPTTVLFVKLYAYIVFFSNEYRFLAIVLLWNFNSIFWMILYFIIIELNFLEHVNNFHFGVILLIVLEVIAIDWTD